MAEPFHISGSDAEFKVRSPIWVGVLVVVTLGVYAVVWVYKIARELSEYGRARGYDLGQNPVATLLAIFPGILIVVPTLVALWRLTKRIQGAQRIAGRGDILNGWLALALYILLAPVYFAYVQSELNRAWAAEGVAAAERDNGLPPRLETGSPEGHARPAAGAGARAPERATDPRPAAPGQPADAGGRGPERP
jgi:Zn-dependent protease with chaperone function